MKVELSTVKGFQDYLPPESLKRKALVEIITKNFELFGFQPIETPIIEFDELMKSSANEEDQDEAVSDRFKLKDKGNRDLGLRYEFTFQLARIFKENPNIKLPFRRYQIGPVFRDEPVNTTRFRQFTQCDADIIGDPTTNADVECIVLFNEILKKFEIECQIQVNNRKLINAIIESVQIKSSEEVMRELDKVQKIGLDNVKINLKKYTSANQVVTLIKLLEKELSFFKENKFEGIEELEELIEKCKKYDVKVIFNPFMVRGFSYYTGNIFEITQKGKSTIAAGGRYDTTVGKYLTYQIPAVGISFGLERLSQLAKIDIMPTIKVIIISLNQDTTSISLAKKFRKNNISCIITEGKPGKSLDYANALQIPYAIFIGEEEVAQKKFKLKDMDSGEEKLLTEKQILVKLMK